MPKQFTKLTRRAQRALSAGGRITEHGITFERLANNDGVYTVNVMVDRQRVHRTIGRESDGVTRTHAENYITEVRSRARHGRLNLPARRKVPLTLATAIPGYLDRLR